MQSLMFMQKIFQKILQKRLNIKSKDGALEEAEKHLKKIKEIFAIVAVSPRAAGLEQKNHMFLKQL